MTSFPTNHALYLVATQQLNLVTATVKTMLLDDEALANKDVQFVSEIVADELAGTGYAGGFGGAGRKVLAGKSWTKDNANDRVYFDATDVSFPGLDAGSVQMAALIVEGTSDADSIVIGFSDNADVVSNGGDIAYVWPAAGILRLSNS